MTGKVALVAETLLARYADPVSVSAHAMSTRESSANSSNQGSFVMRAKTMERKV